MLAAALLAFSLPLLPSALNIVGPVVNQVWDVALDQIIFWDYNSSDPADLSLVLENPGWGINIYLAPTFASDSDYDYYFKTADQNVSLSAIWFAGYSLQLHYYNDMWSLSAKSANRSENVISSLGPITLIDSQNPADASATHPPAAQQHFGALDVPERSTGPPWVSLIWDCGRILHPAHPLWGRNRPHAKV